jgi:hypothetical protein
VPYVFGDGSPGPQEFDTSAFVEAITGRLGHPAEQTVQFAPVDPADGATVLVAPSAAMVAELEELRARLEAAQAQAALRPEDVMPSGLSLPGDARPMTDEQVSALRARWEAVQANAPALLLHDSPGPLLPGWGWPMAEPEDPTPVYDELTQTMPDPRDTGAGDVEEVTGDGVADPPGAQQP